MNAKKLVLFLFAAAGMVACTRAQTIADWTFETTIPSAAGPYSPEVGAGSASGSHALGTTVYSSPAGNGSSHSFSANMWTTGDYFQYQVSTVGLTDITLSYDQNGSSTGPANFQLEYSTDGSSFITVGSQYTLPSGVTWSSGTPNALGNTSFSYNLSSITAINNDPTVYFRIVDESTTAINGNTVGTSGTDRMDNVLIASEVPEPTSLALIGLGTAGLFLFRRRK